MKSNSNSNVSFIKYDAETAIKQDFSYPSSIIYYIKNFQKNLKLYYKFIRVCKYFYSPKDPVPYYYAVNLNPGQKMVMQLYHRVYRLSLNDLEKIERIWLFGIFQISPVRLPLPFYSCLLKKLYFCDILYLLISRQIILFSDFKILTSSKRLQKLYFCMGGSIKYDENNDATIPLDEILACVPNIRSFKFESFSAKCTTASVNKIINVLNPSKLQHFALTNITQPFDFETFFTFIQKNPTILYELSFANEYPLSNEKIEKLQKFVNVIIAVGETENPPPQIFFQGINLKDEKTLKSLLRKYYNR